MDIESIWWLGLLVVFVIVEIATMGLTTIWFAGGSVAGFIASILGWNVIIQVLLFLVVSIVLLVFTRPFAARYINRHHERTNVEGLIGQKAVVTQDIDNIREIGEAKLEGKEWMARTENENIRIPAGTVVKVVRVSGVKLIVKEEMED